MSRNNTGNPIGSKAFPDFEDNVKNLDDAVNAEQDTFQDRLGKSRLTWAGMENQFESDQSEREVQFDADQSSREQQFRTFIASSGYQFAGEYAAGIEITQYNQILRDENGEFWRVSGQVDLPYVTTGEGIPEDDALVPAGDAVLRQDLANPDKGALMVRGAVIYVDTIADLQVLPTTSLVNGQQASVSGGRFIWSSVSGAWELHGPLPAEAMGAKGDDNTDDTSAINAALTQFGSAYLCPGKTYLVSGELSVPEGATLSSSAERATIRTTDTTGVVISLNLNSTAENLRIKLKSGHSSYETGGIRANLGPISVKCYARNIDILGEGSPSTNGSAIIFSGDSGANAFGQFENIYIERVRAGIYANVTNGAYANSNVFSGIVCRSSYRFIHLEAGSDANQFTDINWNASPSGAPPIYCKTNYNIFDGFFFDLHDGIQPDVIAVFEGSGQRNVVRSTRLGSFVGPYVKPQMVDNTRLKLNWYNADRFEVNDHLLRQSEIPNLWMTFDDILTQGNYMALWKPYGGVQDNYLAFADKIHNVTVNGSAPNPTERNIFNPFSYNSSGKPTYIGEAPVVYEIEFLDNNPRRHFDFLQIAFSQGLVAKYIKFETRISSSGEWVVISETFDNKARYVTEYGNINQGISANNSSGIRVTVADPDNGDSIRVESITGRVITTTGTAFFPMGGGTVYGDVAFSSTGTGPVMVAPDGGKWRISVDNSGAISATPI